MIRQATLTSKQHDLSRCIFSRELKLRELYRATGIYEGITKGRNKDIQDAVKRWNDGESLFLEENDIAEGRFLDLSTLPTFLGKVSTEELVGASPKPTSARIVAVSPNISRESTDPGHHDARNKEESGSSQSSDVGQGLTAAAASIPVAEKPLLPGDEKESQISHVKQPLEQGYDAAGAGLSSAPKINSSSLISATPSGHTHPSSSSGTKLNENASEPGFSGSRDLSNSRTGTNLFNPPPVTSDRASSRPESTVAAHNSHQTSMNQTTTKILSQDVREARSAQPLPDKVLDARLKNCVAEENFRTEIRPEHPTKISEQTVQDGGQAQPRSFATGQGVAQSASDDKSSAVATSHLAPSSAQPPGAVSHHNHTNDPSREKSQLGTGKLDPAFISTPATPDEQLRLEELQSLQKAELNLSSRETSGRDPTQPHQRPQASVPTNLVHGDIPEERSHSSSHTPIAGNVVAHQSTLDQAYRQHGHDQLVTKPVAALRDSAFSGMAGDLSKDLTLSRRPPMRIDTGVSSTSELPKTLPTKKNVTPGGGYPNTPLSSSTPNRSSSSTIPAHSPPERMITRVSSGARRHKSVSEILGETPKATPSNGEKVFFDQDHKAMVREDTSIHAPKFPPSATSTESVAFKLRLNELKGKEKNKLSSVVFARAQPPNGLRHLEASHLQSSDFDDVQLKEMEYLQPLFAMQASATAFSRHLHALISSAHKTLSTSSHYVNFHEQQDCRILERIFHLQSSNGWSFRQLARSDEPERPVSHRDVLLSHAKWMATDFKEERKWKIVAAKSIADCCAQWVNGSAEERVSLEIRVRSATTKPGAKQQRNPTPDLIPSAEDDSSVVTDVATPHNDMSYRSAPSAIFSVAPDMFCFGAEKSATTEKLLLELPLYQTSVHFKDAVLSATDEAPDFAWRKPVVPTSKFIEGKMESHVDGPPRKKSRYNYEDTKTIQHHGISEPFLQSDTCNVTIPPNLDIVALLNPDNKHIRDRIHAGHAFRPPTEHVMPSQGFFECRQPSQWTLGEDDELRRLVREYAYNWSLISSCLSSSSKFSSGAERRTPWECFERWLSLEGLPGDMSKTVYFRAYHGRLQAAQKTHEAQQQALQQQQGNNTPHLPMRRRTTQPHLVDQRKNDKHLRMLEAMRKLAKKRETALHKQQHVAGLAAMRKANEAVQPRAAMHTPQEFSRVKYERECKMQESNRALRAQMQQQKVSQAQKAAQQSGQASGGPPGMPPGRPLGPNGNGPNQSMNSTLSNSHPQPSQVSQSRSIPPPPRPVNGAQPNGLHVPPGNPHAIPHAPMQPHPMQQRMQPQISPDNMRVYHEATRVQAEQQRFLLHQRQQQIPHTNGQAVNSASPNMGNLKPMAQNNSAMLASLHGRSSSPSVAAGGPAPNGSSSSPRMTNIGQAQSLSSGLVPAVNEISNQMKNLHPNASPEQLKKMTTDTLMKFRSNHAAQAAMHAAAGASASVVGSNVNLSNLPTPPLPTQPPMMNGVNRSPTLYNPQQQYSQILRNQQSSQQSRNTAPGMGGPRPRSRCGTPQMHRTGSMQGGTAPSQSPRPGSAQIAGPP